MKIACAILGILLVLGGRFLALVNWGIANFAEDAWYPESPLYAINLGTSLLDILGVGLGVTLIGIAAMMSGSRSPKAAQLFPQQPGT